MKIKVKQLSTMIQEEVEIFLAKQQKILKEAEDLKSNNIDTPHFVVKTNHGSYLAMDQNEAIRFAKDAIEKGIFEPEGTDPIILDMLDEDPPADADTDNVESDLNPVMMR